MTTGLRYRIASVLGTVALTTLAVWFVNLELIQRAFSLIPYFGRPAPVVLENGDLIWAITTTLTVTLAAMWPLFKPRPRRILDTMLLTHKRVLLSMVGLAALGYFNYSYRLPRSTLMLATGLLLLWLPAWTVAIRQRPRSHTRAVIVGDDPTAMEAILDVTDLPVLGYVSPPSSYEVTDQRAAGSPELADGGITEMQLDDLSNLGGLSRLDEVLVKHDVDTVLLAFTDTDRAEFFGTLDVCYEHGVTALVHRDHADDVLTAATIGGDLIEVDLEPWDWQDYIIKRLFDLGFAAVGMVILSPIILIIAIAVKLDGPGSVLYAQQRTAEFGETFTVYKFRSMVPNGEQVNPGEEAHRITRVGRVLRRAHLDEIPQLWSILIGDMSVVGPRAAWTDEELLLEEEVSAWSQRWFVKPGLTGLAQINDASSEEPEQKLQYDIEYIRCQSFWFDMKIIIRQFWNVLLDIYQILNGPDSDRY